jgi:hypothetical protein
VRTFDLGAVILDESFEGYRDWTEALGYFTETDSAGICTPGFAFDPYSAGGQRQYLALAINNTSGSGQTVRVSSLGIGLGLWVHNTVLNQVEVELQFRYKAPAAFTGATATFGIANSAFGQTIAEVVVGDDAWHTVTGTWQMQVDSNIFTGSYLELANIPNGADGVFAFDDVRLTRRGPIQREIDNTIPVVPLRINWEEGFRETYRWPTNVQQFEDGSEYREQLRLLPSCRLEYTVRALNAEASGKVDQFLYRYHGQLVAVPRWADAVPFSQTASSGHEVYTTDDFTSRWFQPRQRFLVWESEDNYEAEIIDTINAGRITIDPGEGALTGTFTPGYAKIVPLVPARFVPDLALQRPNNQIGIYPLAFDVQTVQ